jgi:hypothetical protein
MRNDSPAQLTDRELLDATTLAVDRERRSTAELVVLLAEVDSRKLYLGLGYSSVFAYCIRVLRLSEAATYSRITAARTARRFPILLTELREGAITLTTIGLLSKHLTDENHEVLLDAVRHRKKEDVQKLVASLDPQPDIASSVRELPSPKVPESAGFSTEGAGAAPPATIAWNLAEIETRPSRCQAPSLDA